MGTAMMVGAIVVAAVVMGAEVVVAMTVAEAANPSPRGV